MVSFFLILPSRVNNNNVTSVEKFIIFNSYHCFGFWGHINKPETLSQRQIYQAGLYYINKGWYSRMVNTYTKWQIQDEERMTAQLYFFAFSSLLIQLILWPLLSFLCRSNWPKGSWKVTEVLFLSTSRSLYEYSTKGTMEMFFLITHSRIIFQRRHGPSGFKDSRTHIIFPARTHPSVLLARNVYKHPVKLSF